MTAAQVPSAEELVSTRRSWGDTATGLSCHLARADFPRGDLAALRRMGPDSPVPAAFWRLGAEHDLLAGC